MPRSLPTSKLHAVVLGATVEQGAVVVRFAPARGPRPEIEDRYPLERSDDVASVRAVGRLLRVLRAGRIKPPADPWELFEDAERTAELLERCRGARVVLEVVRRIERVLTVWTEAGVDQFRGIVDVEEDEDGLRIRMRGAASALRISRRSMIRFETSTTEFPEVVSVEVLSRTRLH